MKVLRAAFCICTVNCETNYLGINSLVLKYLSIMMISRWYLKGYSSGASAPEVQNHWHALSHIIDRGFVFFLIDAASLMSMIMWT